MLRRGNLLLKIMLAILFSATIIKPQSTQAMYYLNFARSVHSLGMGEQSIALRTSEDALNYNPANLVFTKRPTISFFHQPFQTVTNYFGDLPLNSYSAIFKFNNIGVFGIEYINWELGVFQFAGPDGTVEGNAHAYERSFSLGYAREFCENFSAGIQFRYSKSSLGIASREKLFVSSGLNYSPPILDNKFNIGFSLTNFGTKVWYIDEVQSDPPPSKLNLGIGFIPIENNFYTVQTQLAISKPFDSPPAKSSFEYLFSDWKDFPNDAALHTGIAFNWKPLDLGNGFLFFQELYIGNYSSGNKTQLSNFYTHGGKLGIEFSGIQFSAGYAGRWHNVHYTNYLPWTFPWETVQFSLGMNEELLFKRDEGIKESSKPKNIILSIGFGKSFRIGNDYNIYFYPGTNLSEELRDDILVSLEGAFYLDNQSALVTELSYSPADYYANYYLMQNIQSTKIEIFSISSSYRYHPLEMFSPFYFQGGLTIVRLNPVEPYFYPRYDYKTALLFSIGGIFELYEGIILNPFITYSLMFSRLGNTPPQLGGFNQFDAGLKIGYKF